MNKSEIAFFFYCTVLYGIIVVTHLDKYTSRSAHKQSCGACGTSESTRMHVGQYVGALLNSSFDRE